MKQEIEHIINNDRWNAIRCIREYISKNGLRDIKGYLDKVEAVMIEYGWSPRGKQYEKDEQALSVIHAAVRKALTGKDQAPPNLGIMEILGVEETIKRLDNWLTIHGPEEVNPYFNP